MDHGTEEMYRKHLREKSPVCDPCLRAHAEEVAEYRRTHPRDRSGETRVMTIKRRALNRLALAHPEEFAALVEQENARSRS